MIKIKSSWSNKNDEQIHKLYTQIFVFSESEEGFSLFYMQYAFLASVSCLLKKKHNFSVTFSYVKRLLPNCSYAFCALKIILLNPNSALFYKKKHKS